MNELAATTVFFVKDGERSLGYYTRTLGFSLDWKHAPNGRALVFQVSMLGFRLIINEVEDLTQCRAGLGRVFVGVEVDQLPLFRLHVEGQGLQFEVVAWGEPTLQISDPDGNWLSFWLPAKDRANLRIGSKWP